MLSDSGQSQRSPSASPSLWAGFLTRNGHPFKYLDLDRDADVRHLLDRFRVDPAEIPVVICRGETVLKNPSDQQIADVSASTGESTTIVSHVERWLGHSKSRFVAAFGGIVNALNQWPSRSV